MVKYKNLYQGIGKILRGKEMQEYLESEGSKMAGRAGNGYGCRVHNSGQRQIANVYPETEEAMQDNLQNNTLLKAMR